MYPYSMKEGLKYIYKNILLGFIFDSKIEAVAMR